MPETVSKLPFLHGLGRNVVVFGVVSLLTDISSEMLYPVIPLFLTTVLQAPMPVIGLIEGFAESAASLFRVVSGWYSDKMRRRKPFAVAGYGISAVSKPLLALAFAWPMVLGARVLDRFGKGIRAAPRDAMIAASCDRQYRGKAFGLHKAMDTVGAVLGPLLAVGLMAWMGSGERTYRIMFVLAIIPAALGVGVLWALAKEPPDEAVPPDPVAVGHGRISRDLKKLLVVLGVFAVGNSSDVFLLLRAKDVGFSVTEVLVAYALCNTVLALTAMPAGQLSDRIGRKRIVLFGFLVFAIAPSGWILWLLFGLYGIYGAATEGIWKAVVADVSTPQNRGTAMGLMQTVNGIMAFFASFVAGLLWAKVGQGAPFWFGAICAAVAAVLFFAMFYRRPRPQPI